MKNVCYSVFSWLVLFISSITHIISMLMSFFFLIFFVFGILAMFISNLFVDIVVKKLWKMFLKPPFTNI